MSYIMSGDFAYTINSSSRTAIVSEFITDNPQVVIPDTIQGFSVIGIGRAVFTNNKNIQSVEIPYSVLYVGAEAFKNSSVELVTFKNRPIEHDIFFEENKPECYLYHSVFENCAKLKKVVLRSKTVIKDWNVFANCISLTEINSEELMENIPRNSFKNCQSLDCFTIAHEVYVADEAFSGCQFNEFWEFTSSTYSDDFFESIQTANIYCWSRSKLVDLTYMGLRVVLIDLLQ